MNEGPAGPSNKAKKLLERTKANKSDWSPDHYRKLLGAFGFAVREGGKHTIYSDPQDSENFVIVPRHGKVLSYVADDAIKAIEIALRSKED